MDELVLTGEVKSGLPSFELPWTRGLNATETDSDPLAMAQEFGSGLVIVPLLNIIQHLAIVKFYKSKVIVFSWESARDRP